MWSTPRVIRPYTAFISFFWKSHRCKCCFLRRFCVGYWFIDCVLSQIISSICRPAKVLHIMYLAHCKFPRKSPTLWGDFLFFFSAVFGTVDLKLASPGSVEPRAAVVPEMNAQYLNLAYLVLSPHPVGSACQHNHTAERNKTQTETSWSYLLWMLQVLITRFL